VTAIDLVRLRFPAAITRDVNQLTRRAGTYQQYIEHLLTAKDSALRVKLADLADNLNDSTGHGSEGLRARYIKADIAIRAELKRRTAANL
jgi:hypothetical protein